MYLIPLFFGVVGYFIEKVRSAYPPVSPFTIWVPYDLSNLIYYWLTLGTQVFSALIGDLIGLSYTSCFSSSMMILHAQIEMLKYRFKYTMKIIEKKYNSKEEINDNELMGIEKKLITDFVDYHCDILKLAKIITEIFSITIFCQYSMSTILICTSAYTTSSVPLFSTEFFILASVCFISISQITMVCLVSHNLTIQVN